MAGFSTRKHLKAYVRYDGTGRIIPGSLILNKFKPAVGDWSEINAYECCNPTPPIPLGCNNFWINQTFNPEGPEVAAVGAGIDSQCNSFIFIDDSLPNPNNPNTESLKCFLLQKFDDGGNLVWNRVFDFVEDGNSLMFAQAMTMDKEDNPICFITYTTDLILNTVVYAIVKFDNNGNQLWSKALLNDSPEAEYVNSAAFDSFNNMYVSSGAQYINVRKISPAGVVLASKIITFVGGSSESYLSVNSTGEVYLIATDTNPLDYKQHIIKLDSSLNEIWNKSFSTPVNCYLYGAGLDKDENVVFQVGRGISSEVDPIFGTYIKISPEGNVLGTVKMSNVTEPTISLGTYQLNLDSEGNTYISSAFPTAIPGYTNTAPNFLVIAKISSSGTFEWAYALDDSLGNNIYTWFYYCPIAGNLVNNSLVLGCYDDDDPYNARLFKLPLTLIPDGSYGNYTITNITNLWTTSSPTVTLSDDTANYSNGSTDTDPLTYLTFEGTYTTTNIPL